MIARIRELQEHKNVKQRIRWHRANSSHDSLPQAPAGHRSGLVQQPPRDTSNQPTSLDRESSLSFSRSVPFAHAFCRRDDCLLSFFVRKWHAPIPNPIFLYVTPSALAPAKNFSVLTSRRGVVLYPARPESGKISVYTISLATKIP